VALLFGWIPTFASVGLMLAAIVIVLAFILGLALFFSAINVRFRDAQNFVEIIRTVATWSSPILYTWVMVKDATESVPWLFHLYMLNPITVAVELFHEAVWVRLPSVAELPSPPPNATWPPDFGWYVVGAVTIIVFALVVGQLVFRRFERTFAQDL
jgi:ABC-2 type transport system permease protein